MKIPPHHIHVWTVDLVTSQDQTDHLLSLLSPDEQERAHRIRLSTPKQRFVAARGYLRKILSFYLSTDPRMIHIAYNQHRKPYLRDNITGLQFNLSHSHDVAVYAITVGKPIGIDIEKMQPDYHPDIAKRYFSPIENTALMSLPLAAQAPAFYRIWSRKEALVKAIGKGMTLSLSSFSVSIHDETEDIELEHSIWSLTPLVTPPHFAGALATQQSIQAISYWQLTGNEYIMTNTFR